MSASLRNWKYTPQNYKHFIYRGKNKYSWRHKYLTISYLKFIRLSHPVLKPTNLPLNNKKNPKSNFSSTSTHVPNIHSIILKYNFLKWLCLRHSPYNLTDRIFPPQTIRMITECLLLILPTTCGSEQTHFMAPLTALCTGNVPLK